MRIGILTGGGDVPGLNPCIKAVVSRAEADGMTVVGIRRGWGGLLNYNPDDPADSADCIEPLTAAGVRTIDRYGGTHLHTSRTNPAKVSAKTMPVFLRGRFEHTGEKQLADCTFKFVVGSAALAAPPISRMQYADVRSIDLFGPTLTDHALSADAITVGAALYSDARRTAPFSSHGPVAVYWAPVESIRAAPPLPEPAIRAKPDIIATTGARTTFYGRVALGGARCNPGDLASAVCRFFGTSAAAPHVAGVLALVKQRAYQRDIALDQGQARQLLARTAQWMRGTPEDRGAGLVDAAGAVAAVADLSARPAAAPGQFQMPELFDMTEMQARETLLRLGVRAALIVSDYQDRAKLGELFDRVAPFHVVSSLPHSGEIVNSGTTVVLGVRAPEPLPAPK